MIDYQGGGVLRCQNADGLHRLTHTVFDSTLLSYFTLKINLFIKNAVRRFPVFRACTLSGGESY